MRAELNFNMLPIVQDNINDIAYNPTIQHQSLTNISSSNGYYGYQAPLDDKTKINNNDNNLETMQVDDDNLALNNRQKLVVNRKRAFDACNEFRPFKKRRENTAINEEDIDDNAKKKSNGGEFVLYEQLLNATHGCAIYHWISTP